MVTAVLLALCVSLAINAILFAIAYHLQSDKLTDISYALSFLTLDILALTRSHNRNSFSVLLFLAVALWAVRIGGFLLVRVLLVGKDRRFDGIRHSMRSFGKFWLGQAVTAWVVMLPVVFAQQHGGVISVLTIIGLSACLAGIAIEALADYQKLIFKQQVSNQGKWIQNGIWKYSRHPNYFGEMLVWTGVYIFCFSALDGILKIVGLASPLLIIILLRYVSGIPILEKSADERWGTLDEYQRYKRSSYLLVPFPKLIRS